jgi:hypothetical protein
VIGQRYPDKAGVPPVDKGMLMCYNVGDVTRVESGNSIFDKAEVLKYLKGKNTYPLPLDYAFPIFEWGAIYRNDELIRLLPADRFYFDAYVEDGTYELMASRSGTRKFKVKEELELWDYQLTLKKDDIIKHEKINYGDLIEVARKLSSMNTNPTPNVVLFYFDAENVRKNEANVKKIFNSF